MCVSVQLVDLFEKRLQILLPLDVAVALADLGLEEVIVGHCSRQSSEGLSPTPSHSHQQSITSRLLYDATDPR